MYIVFLALFLAFVLFCVVNGVLDIKKPKDVITEEMKCKDYIQSSAVLWGTSLAVFLMCLIGKISFEDIGFRPISFNYNIWFTVITLIVSGLAFIYFIFVFISSLINAKWLEKEIKNTTPGINAVLPRTKKEKRLFPLLALSAGICEEIFYRGFLVFLLYAIFPSMPIYLLILFTGIFFGVSHFYQGIQGVINTGITGILLMSLFLVTNSLILPMLLHFIMDFSSTFILQEENVS